MAQGQKNYMTHMDVFGGVAIFDLQDYFLGHSELSWLIHFVQKASNSIFSCKKNRNAVSAVVL